jgi:hypothetical protein
MQTAGSRKWTRRATGSQRHSLGWLPAGQSGRVDGSSQTATASQPVLQHDYVNWSCCNFLRAALSGTRRPGCEPFASEENGRRPAASRRSGQIGCCCRARSLARLGSVRARPARPRDSIPAERIHAAGNRVRLAAGRGRPGELCPARVLLAGVARTMTRIRIRIRLLSSLIVWRLLVTQSISKPPTPTPPIGLAGRRGSWQRKVAGQPKR